ncbi:unnamed protein product [Notodromas monacha]|uniref:Peptidase M13 C-terminal domain-containing protein n=1 Tax=Notodromas monacha TaxID=399045 RepID=A0A7R9BPR8_9CRUS|nr:unnamed protein product [Notodromas monacha]CAG0918065.1 unnamed protein product [Notodromas monacha]
MLCSTLIPDAFDEKPVYFWRCNQRPLQVKSLLGYVQDSIASRTAGFEWMSSSIRKQLVAATRGVNVQVGGFDGFWTNEYFSESSVKISSVDCPDVQLYLAFTCPRTVEIPENASYLETFMINYLSEPSGDLHAVLNNPVDRLELLWTSGLSPSTVNAFYSHEYNIALFPLAYLQGAFFPRDVPGYLKFSSIGETLAHEMLHWLDPKGHAIDAKGNKYQSWRESETTRYDAFSTCLSTHYVDTFKNVTLKGTFYPNYDPWFALPENLCDVLGLDFAMAAYRRWVDDHGRDVMLPGIDFEADQIFLINAAQMSCTVLDDWWLAYLLETDEHTPASQRINGQMSNLAEFGKIFNCPADSPLNPKSKCT